tara:strand:- start:630 stop:800 length:171 start_codon:yes stop_codon:yes gene_type:complete
LKIHAQPEVALVTPAFFILFHIIQIALGNGLQGCLEVGYFSYKDLVLLLGLSLKAR